MKAKVLKTERDHQAALAYVERLRAQSSPAEAELKLWSLLIDRYLQVSALPRRHTRP